MDDKTKEFIKRFEGYSDSVYNDTADIPTVGYGSNLRSPEVSPMLENLGIDKKRVLSGESVVPEDVADDLMDQQLQEKRSILGNILKKDAPNAQISDNERTALESMIYNSPKLIGPNLRSLIDANDKPGVAREILLRSNKHKEPGILKRRIEEAKMYMGDGFDDLINSLNDEELVEIQSIMDSMDNPHEKMRLYDEYPFLKSISPQRKYKKIFKK